MKQIQVDAGGRLMKVLFSFPKLSENKTNYSQSRPMLFYGQIKHVRMFYFENWGVISVKHYCISSSAKWYSHEVQIQINFIIPVITMLPACWWWQHAL